MSLTEVSNIFEAIIQETVQVAFKKIAQVSGKKGLVNTRRAMSIASNHILATWQGMVSGGAIAGTDKTVNNREYRNALKNVPIDDFEYHIGVLPEGDDIAKEVEDGKPEVRMRDFLHTYKKRRVDKHGSPYLIVPFRHKTKKLKEHGIYNEASQLGKSSIAGMHNDENGVKRYSYNWAKTGGRLIGHPNDSKANKRSKTGRFEGMVRMEKGSGREKRSHYMTFRVLSMYQIKNGVRVPANPSTWVIPKKAGLGLNLRDVAFNETRSRVNSIVQRGIDNDLLSMKEMVEKQ